MTEDPIEDLPPEKKAKGGGGSSILALLSVVILLPVLSFAMAEFVLIPRIVERVNHTREDSAHPESGPPGLAPPLERRAGGGGGGHGGGGGDPHAYAFDNIVANLSGSLKSRYIKVSFSVEGSHEHFAEIMEGNKARLIDATLSVLSSLTVADLEAPGVKNVVRSDLINSFHTALQGRVVENLYFSEFVVQ